MPGDASAAFTPAARRDRPGVQRPGSEAHLQAQVGEPHHRRRGQVRYGYVGEGRSPLDSRWTRFVEQSSFAVINFRARRRHPCCAEAVGYIVC